MTGSQGNTRKNGDTSHGKPHHGPGPGPGPGPDQDQDQGEGKGEDKYDFDYFVIGGGSGGVRSARIAASHGARVGLAESGDLGGTCVNLGCVPKKLFAYAADFAAGFEDARGFGWIRAADGRAGFDWAALKGNKDKEIKRLNGIYKSLLEKAGVVLFQGFAGFVDPHTLRIEHQDGTLSQVTAARILIATGGTPHLPEIEGKELLSSSDDMFHLDTLPKKAVIIGGGYIAVEFAHILHGLGVEVTLLYRGPLFLRGFDRDIREHLAAEMQKQGIELLFSSTPARIEKTDSDSEKMDGGGLIVHLEDGRSVPCDLALAATGRAPLTGGALSLDNAGVTQLENGLLPVNGAYQTSQAHIYALGDIIDGPKLTPVAIAQGHALADHLFASPAVPENGAPDRTSGQNSGQVMGAAGTGANTGAGAGVGAVAVPALAGALIPTAVFSAPPIGTVGLSEEQAQAQGLDIAVYLSRFRPLIHTLSGRDEQTLMKLIVDQKTDRVVGVHLCGRDAPEILQGVAVAMRAGATKADFDATIGIHPTSAEELVTMRTQSPPGPPATQGR